MTTRQGWLSVLAARLRVLGGLLEGRSFFLQVDLGPLFIRSCIGRYKFLLDKTFWNTVMPRDPLEYGRASLERG